MLVIVYVTINPTQQRELKEMFFGGFGKACIWGAINPRFPTFSSFCVPKRKKTVFVLQLHHEDEQPKKHPGWTWVDGNAGKCEHFNEGIAQISFQLD